MLIILLLWVFLFFSSFSFGLFTHSLLAKLTGGNRAFSVAATSVTGLVSLAVVLSYCSLFIPMNSVMLQAAIAGITIAGILYYKKDFMLVWATINATWRQTDILQKIFIAVFFFFILIKASGQVQSLDSGSYHLPFIKWVEQYKLITGLGNVHSRFGFNYHYHILYAFFGFANIFGTTIHCLNGYLFLIGFVYLIGMYNNAGENLLYKAIAIISILYISQINKGMTGFSPDFPVAIIQMIIVYNSLQYLITRQASPITRQDENNILLSIFWLAFGAVTLKLATVSVFFVIISVFFTKMFRPAILFTLVIFAILIFFPYLFRNYTISGYLVYPFYAVDIFHVPWKIPMARTIDEKIVIKNFALGYPYYYIGEYHYNATLFRNWIKNLSFLNKAYPPIIGVIAACLAATFIKWIIDLLSKGKKSLLTPVNIVLCGLVAGILFWFYNAPDPRFGNGIIIPFIAIVLGILFIALRLSRCIKVVSAVIMLAVIASSVLSLSGKAVSQTAYQTNNVNFNFLIQEKYPEPDSVSISVDAQHVFRCKERCWECPLPCSYTYDSFRFAAPGEIEKGFLPKAIQPEIPEINK